MMKRKKRILIGGSIVLIAAICGAIFLFNGKTQPTKSLAKQVEEDYTGIEDDRRFPLRHSSCFRHVYPRRGHYGVCCAEENRTDSLIEYMKRGCQANKPDISRKN